jgi:hypothetical protein
MLRCQEPIYRRAGVINGALRVTLCFKSVFFCLCAVELNLWKPMKAS